MQPSARPAKRQTATTPTAAAAGVSHSTVSTRSRAPQFNRNYSANAVPPSTVIRSRLQSITERVPLTLAAPGGGGGGARGTKRQLVDDSPSTTTADTAPASWSLALETPIRQPAATALGRRNDNAAAATPSLLDTLMMRPQRLFAHISPLNGARTPLARREMGNGSTGDNNGPSVQQQQQQPSPARSILESACKESEYLGKLETARRETERARFELRQLETDRENERVDARRTQQCLEADLAAQTKRVEKLERDRRWLFEQEEQLAEQRRAVEREMAAQRSSYEARIDKMADAARELEQRLDDAHRAMRRLKAEHLDTTDDLHTRLARAERTVAELQGLEEKNRPSDEASADVVSLQYIADSMRRELRVKDQDIAELQLRLRTALSGSEASADNADAADVVPLRERTACLERDLREQCDYIKAVEQQNSQLRSKLHALVEVSTKYEREHELARSLQAKVDRLEKQQEEHAEAEARFAALQQEREQWGRVFGENQQQPGDAGKHNAGGQQHAPCSPFAAAKTMAAQKNKIQLLETKLQALQDARDSDDLQLQRIAEDAKTCKRECARLESEVAEERTRAIKLDASRQHAVREAEFLRTQLHSYDREEDSLMGGNYDRQKAARIEQLERFIDEQRAWIASLESTVGSSAAAATSSPRSIDARVEAGHSGLETASASLLQGYREDAEAKQRELDGLREEHRRLGERYGALEKETARLEHQVGAGLGYNPRTTRILQLIDNPAAQDYAIRSEKLKAMTAENEALVERIRQLEQQRERPEENKEEGPVENAEASSSFFHTIDNLRTENTSLTRQLEDSVKLISRYKKEWKKKAAELREVVYLILGYRVDFLANGSVRFTSTYAAEVDQSFVFTSGEGNHGVMQLTGGGSKPYLQSLANDIRYWVQERGSIPGFLATITLQGFEARLDQPPHSQ
ncbi:coiled-coil domain-containing protein mad1 [Coemansia sp. RSA 1200]|nr:coiled-coil domain-containing protein mad1 [Coemansia sp. RSA 1200]